MPDAGRTRGVVLLQHLASRSGTTAPWH